MVESLGLSLGGFSAELESLFGDTDWVIWKGRQSCNQAFRKYGQMTTHRLCHFRRPSGLFQDFVFRLAGLANKKDERPDVLIAEKRVDRFALRVVCCPTQYAPSLGYSCSSSFSRSAF
jgi:hypothetical protein